MWLCASIRSMSSGGAFILPRQFFTIKTIWPPLAVKDALKEAKVTMTSIDGVAFTRGPGMPGCLGVGMNAAKTLASSLNKPLVGVHHMQAHALTPMLTSSQAPEFPFLALMISGGHTMILLASSETSFELLANTVDVSIGNAFDKVSRELGLPWTDAAHRNVVGAGPMLEKVAEEHASISSCDTPAFPVPMRGRLAFSYGGLMSSVQRHVANLKGNGPLRRDTQSSIAYSFQVAAIDQLREKLSLALDLCRRRSTTITTVVISGGVASNKYLRSRLENFLGHQQLAVHYPPPSLCTDNAAMIGWASMQRFLLGDCDPYTIRLKPAWPITELQGSH
ncbi:Gcp-like domain-containing protein [Cantharellus anzutake]|uniref:Gcp-like domain-containing protein n=1 Tax=Cantharellus anzutake TaxID=1750568 RepID=UPI0019069D47|nr:Gcp-like domain-containing protein [Cantharellus anzutake]KAF8319584.1 Gcp-like domain-containing protein [Cantharellus anzutake]